MKLSSLTNFVKPLLLFLFLFLFLAPFQTLLFAQTPQVPHKMTFAGMSLTIRDDAREEIQKDVDALTRSPKFFDIKVERARSYFPIIEKIFREENIPDDLKYLVLQESALIPDAVSTSNAVGFWQFKEATAIEFGLKVNALVDERMNIASATRGAAQYFRKSYGMFSNWILVVQSYQMGMGGTSRAMGTKFNGLRHQDITTETYWYVKKFLAHKVAFEKSWQGIPQISLTPMTVSSGINLDELAQMRGIPVEQIRDYNKWAKNGSVPADGEYVVVLPAGDRGSPNIPVASNAAPTRGRETPAEGVINYNGLKAIRATKNESLLSISTRSGVKISKFLKWNEVTAVHKPVEGQIYYLESKKRSGENPTYITTGKETLWSLSQDLGLRKNSLARLNPEVKEGALKSGMIVRLASEKQTNKMPNILGVDPRRPFEWTSGQ